LNREFRRFIGMSPKAFAQSDTPLFDAGLRLRNMRKAEATSSGRGGTPAGTSGHLRNPG